MGYTRGWVGAAGPLTFLLGSPFLPEGYKGGAGGTLAVPTEGVRRAITPKKSIKKFCPPRDAADRTRIGY